MNEKDEKERNYDLQERLIEFAVRVLNVVEESRKDFIHKMKIALKEQSHYPTQTAGRAA